jgi:hypothetical protein
LARRQDEPATPSVVGLHSHEDTVAVVTGASGGIGAATAGLLAPPDASVARIGLVIATINVEDRLIGSWSGLS